MRKAHAIHTKLICVADFHNSEVVLWASSPAGECCTALARVEEQLSRYRCHGLWPFSGARAVQDDDRTP